jgi:hypothetical protein
MARRYSIRNIKREIAKNGGQVAQEWLKSVGVNVSRFKTPCEQTGERIRRKNCGREQPVDDSVQGVV